MENIDNGWFKEINEELMPGAYLAYEINQVIHHEKSKYQDILFLDTKTYGTMLVTDGMIQCTEKDEFAYQEMISFLPLCAHKNPEKVLIVGGGDGGVAREVTKHPKVKKITQVEIDGRVVETSKKYLPTMAIGFDSPKLTLIIDDGFKYMQNHKEEFDVIITDSGDPIGPAVNLFTESYFQLLKNALKPGGIICSQIGTIWQDIPQIKNTLAHCKKHFKEVKYAYTTIPTYPTGQIGFGIASLDANCDLNIPKLKLSPDDLKTMNLKYYSSEMHPCAFVLPNFARIELET